MAVTNILIVGVGGQGTILASRIIAGVMQDTGCDVKVSEIHGMSQRGGSVVTQVRYGEKVYSPIIQPGTVDVIIAFELLEAKRYLPWLKKDGRIIVNSQQIKPMPVVTGAVQYPVQIEAEIKQQYPNALFIDALALATAKGNPKGVNVLLLGALSAVLPTSHEAWITAVKANVPAKFLEGNLAVFEAGRNCL